MRENIRVEETDNVVIVIRRVTFFCLMSPALTVKHVCVYVYVSYIVAHVSPCASRDTKSSNEKYIQTRLISASAPVQRFSQRLSRQNCANALMSKKFNADKESLRTYFFFLSNKPFVQNKLLENVRIIFNKNGIVLKLEITKEKYDRLYIFNM